MDEILIRVMTRLVRVHDELGERCFEEAAHRALLSIALAVQFEAERKAGSLQPPNVDQEVVPFPLSSTRRDRIRRDSPT
jgi:hypothetical protein